jgi:hypothetical protein
MYGRKVMLRLFWTIIVILSLEICWFIVDQHGFILKHITVINTLLVVAKRQLTKAMMIVICINTEDSVVIITRNRWFIRIYSISILLLDTSVLCVQLLIPWWWYFNFIYRVIHMIVIFRLLQKGRRFISLSQRLLLRSAIRRDVFFLRMTPMRVNLRILDSIQKFTSRTIKLVKYVVIKARL